MSDMPKMRALDCRFPRLALAAILSAPSTKYLTDYYLWGLHHHRFPFFRGIQIHQKNVLTNFLLITILSTIIKSFTYFLVSVVSHAGHTNELVKALFAHSTQKVSSEMKQGIRTSSTTDESNWSHNH